MTETEQQRQTLEFFESYAGEWRRLTESVRKLNMIQQRNSAAERLGRKMAPFGRFLDVGCGTGELVLDLAPHCALSEGIDFSPEMVRLCDQKRDAMGIANARFYAGSIFDHQAEPGSLDLIAANGFIEYISFEQLDAFLDLCRVWLKPGGRVIVSSRNRLLNLFSLNDYTAMELALGTLEGLSREAMAIAACRTTEDAVRAAEEAGFDQDPPDDHPITGVPVKPRYQYTPGQMARRLRGHGLVPEAVSSVHFHGVVPSLAAENPALHSEIAHAVHETLVDDPRALPASSTFMITARRP